jgi:hypothetical protein
LLHHRALQQHFTEAPGLNDLMCHLLGNVEGLRLLEPCVGHGAFLGGLHGRPASIDAVDLDGAALETVRQRFGRASLELFQADFIDLFVGDSGRQHSIHSRTYDAVVANPPYGLRFDLAYRRRIKRAYPDAYARESYGLFLRFAVSRLAPGGRYVFLVPDTFLASVNHRPLRAFLGAEAAPSHIIRFPSRHFGTVAFGYGNLSIVAGHKRPLATGDPVRWLDLFGTVPPTPDALGGARVVAGGDLIGAIDTGWSADLGAASARDGWTVLGNLAQCRTGLYTGDNARFLGYDAGRAVRRSNGHPIDWARQVLAAPRDGADLLTGVEGERHYVPLIRGGHRAPFEPTAWAVDWSRSAVAAYKTAPKARFQNAAFYFRPGLSVPMVTTNRISAGLMAGAVFDQGVVGVFPAAELIPALLLYLNSRTASATLKRLVNGSANNSANYLKRLPVPAFPPAALAEAAETVAEARSIGRLDPALCDAFAGRCGAAVSG